MHTATTALGLTLSEAEEMPLQTIGWMMVAHMRQQGLMGKTTVNLTEAEAKLDLIEAMLADGDSQRIESPDNG
jgi:hypothetical protein